LAYQLVKLHYNRGGGGRRVRVTQDTALRLERMYSKVSEGYSVTVKQLRKIESLMIEWDMWHRYSEGESFHDMAKDYGCCFQNIFQHVSKYDGEGTKFPQLKKMHPFKELIEGKKRPELSPLRRRFYDLIGGDVQPMNGGEKARS